MIPLKKALSSSIGKKLITALSGLALVGFVIMHLLGNLTLLAPTGHAFNAYAYKLHSFGALMIAAEVGLAAVFLAHIFNGIRLKLDHRAARPVGYIQSRTKGGPSRSNVSSRNMAITGTVITIFLVLHVWRFRFGPTMADGYVTELNGEPVRDLYRVVKEAFSNPLVVSFYVFVMIMLGAHLRHGFWSAFQSLGAMNPRISKPITCLGWLLAIALSVGFLMIPLWMYFGVNA